MHVLRYEIRRWASQVASTLSSIPALRTTTNLKPEYDSDLSLLDEEEPRSLLLPLEEDISHYGQVNPTFNFAQYINTSETLQNFVKLGVNLSKIEKKPHFAQTLLRLDFESDVKKYLVFLNDYVPSDELGSFITKNPMIFKEDLDNLQVRINYLESKKFNKDMIKRIVSKNPFWLMFKTAKIDSRLGYFQKQYYLTGDNVRQLTCTQPNLITYKMAKIILNTFALKEEMGFSSNEIRKLILEKPRLLMINQLSLIKTFNYIHLKMNISHDDILKIPGVLLCKVGRIKERDQFLKKIGRAQYDPTKPKYVSLFDLIEGDDAKFCLDVAECSLKDYNTYLKSL